MTRRRGGHTVAVEMAERDESGRIADRLIAIRQRLARMREESDESLRRLASSREAGERSRSTRGVDAPLQEQPPPAP